MHIYLPIAELPVNVLALLLLGGVAGLLSGMFGVGGGFIMTPFLIFMGVPPSVAVASSSNQIIAASVSGFLAHWRRQNVDFLIGKHLLAGGLIGASLGVWLFAHLKGAGHLDLVISLCYVFFLGGVGVLMAMESARTILHVKPAAPKPSTLKARLERLPLQREYSRSNIKVSALLPLGVGVLSGALVSLMGIGGGFILIPAMIYLLGMPTSLAIGTSLFQIIFITSHVTFLQAVTTQSVDIVLSLLLLAGAVVGAQIGTRYASRLPAEHLRAMLALLVLAVSLKLAAGLFIRPADVFSLAVAP
ncbi:MAG: sulfite exporter TauE/SafE family protein [Alphaproteobacteria bacterium]|nr:sulfite exporter TauE/SafE family protein [Alphaproteobacteria bacterium]